MPSVITKIRLINFRRFKDYTIDPKERINILVGDNEVGKSSVLEAIDIVAGGNIRRVESIGIEKLLNIESVSDFFAGLRTFSNLPRMIIELYLAGTFDHAMNGKNNTLGIKADGIRLVCEPNIDFSTEISESMRTQDGYFPYDYYSIRFSTFADEEYTGYKRKLRSIFIDSTNLDSDYATKDFVKRMYSHYTEDNIKVRAVHRSKYRYLKDSFRTDSLRDLNETVPANKNYTFGLKKSTTTGFEDDLMIYEGDIGIDSKGTGRQVFIKTDFTLQRSGDNIDAVLIEEPENHLSHINLRKLIASVANSQGGQLFVTTHSSLISTRLELRNLFIMHESFAEKPTSLRDLHEDTARYFMKAPVASILEFTISSKAILVEGPSEYMLFEEFYKTVSGNKPEMDGVNIIDVRGLSFKRYLEIAKLLKSKVAVVTDNDGDAQKHCIDKYVAYANDANIEIFYEKDDCDSKSTFEKILYEDNKKLCDKLFGDAALKHMLNDKTEAAYTLMEQSEAIIVPDYIKRAITWIKMYAYY